MIGDHPNLPEANHQPVPQQPLILGNKPESLLEQLAGIKAQQPLLDQPTDMNAQQPLLDQPTDMNARQPLLDQPIGMNTHQNFPDMQHPFPDMQPTFAQQPLLDPEQPLLDMQQPFSDMEQTLAQTELPFPDAQQWQQPFPEAHQSPFGYTHEGPVRPEHLIYRQSSASFANPFAKLAHLWRSDPAYRVFFIALAIVLISGLVCLALINNLFKAPSSTPQGQTTGINSSAPVKILTPMPTPIPTPSPTPTIEPTTPPPPAPSQLTVEITNVPSVVMNNTTTSVSVATNQPGVSVSLFVTYSNASPSSFNGGSKTTNSNGQATLSWHVNVRPFKKFSTITAHVTVYAQDTNGQSATSQTATAQVFTFQAG